MFGLVISLWLLLIVHEAYGDCHGYDLMAVCINPCEAPLGTEVVLVTGGEVDFSCVPPSVKRIQVAGYVDCKGTRPNRITLDGVCGSELDLRHTLAFTSTTTEETISVETQSEETKPVDQVDQGQDPAQFKLAELWPFIKKETRVTSKARTTSTTTTSRPSGQVTQEPGLAISYDDLKEIILILVAGGLVLLAVVLTLLMSRPNSVARRLGRSLSTRLWGSGNQLSNEEVALRRLDGVTRRPRHQGQQGPTSQPMTQTTQTTASLVANRTTSRGCGGSVHWGPMTDADDTDLFGPSSTDTVRQASDGDSRPIPQPRKKTAAPLPPTPLEDTTYAVPRAPPLPTDSLRPVKEKDSGSGSSDSSPEGFERRTSRFTRRARTWLTSSEVPQHPLNPLLEDSAVGFQKKPSPTPAKAKDWRPKQLKLPKKDATLEAWSDVELLEDEDKDDKKKKREGKKEDPDYEN